MLKRFFLAIMLLFMLFSFAYAEREGDVATLGSRDSDGNYDWGVDSSGNLVPGEDSNVDLGSSSYYVEDAYIENINTDGLTTYGSGSGIKYNVEEFTSGDTLTAAETGKICITTVSSTAYSVFTLPAAVSGLQFTFTSGNPTTGYYRVNPNGTETIKYLTCVAGDSITSAGASADSVTLVGGTGVWYVTAMKGTFTDSN